MFKYKRKSISAKRIKAHYRRKESLMRSIQQYLENKLVPPEENTKFKLILKINHGEAPLTHHVDSEEEAMRAIQVVRLLKELAGDKIIWSLFYSLKSYSKGLWEYYCNDDIKMIDDLIEDQDNSEQPIWETPDV